MNNIDNVQFIPYNATIICEGNIVSNLLLITDVARLRNVFSGLTDDKAIRLRIANNLEKGGEEIITEKPDVVFVQTHLSGLSADILIMHLKKQLGRKRSSFVLLAAPNQVNETILTPYKGWLDTSVEDDVLRDNLHNLLESLTARKKKIKGTVAPETSELDLPDLTIAATPAGDVFQTTVEKAPSQPVRIEEISGSAAETTPEPSLEEQGITYSPRPRLTVQSEFNSSFDNFVDSTPAPELITESATAPKQDWNTEQLKLSGFSSSLSKRSTFFLWLVPVIIAVVVATFLQQRRSSPIPDTIVTAPTVSASQALKPSPPTLPAEMSKPSPVTDTATSSTPATATDHGVSDKTAMPGLAENRGKKDPATSTSKAAAPTSLPDFIPRYGFDKHFSAANPGWERYNGQVTEFKVYRESRAIKTIQVIDRGGQGVPESFMKAALRQVVKKPVFTVESTEKKDGYEIQRGHVADNLRVVYYRDAKGGKLRAFAISWQ